MPIALAPVIGAGISAAGGLISSFLNNKSQKERDERNLEFQKENQDYQRALQQQIFEREDTAHQREVSDLRAAGLNPLLSTGSGAGAGSVVPTEALHSDYATDYSGIAQGAIAAGQGIANSYYKQEDLNLRREMQQEQLLQMRAQRQKIAADTMRSLLGYENDSAHLEEYYAYGGHRKAMADYEEEMASINMDEKRGRISHEEAANRREELRSQRDEGVYEHNMEYARNHNLPYGQGSTGIKYLADVIADIYGDKRGGTALAHDIVKSTVEGVTGKVNTATHNKQLGQLLNAASESFGEYKNYDEALKAFQNAARLSGVKLKPEDLKVFHQHWTDFKNIGRRHGSSSSGRNQKYTNRW